MTRYQHNRKRILQERSRKGVDAKASKRISESESLIECGGCLTWGSLGHHDIRLLAYPDGGSVAVVVDGQHKRPRTLRGVWKCLAKMMAKGMEGT